MELTPEQELIKTLRALLWRLPAFIKGDHEALQTFMVEAGFSNSWITDWLGCDTLPEPRELLHRSLNSDVENTNKSRGWTAAGAILFHAVRQGILNESHAQAVIDLLATNNLLDEITVGDLLKKIGRMINYIELSNEQRGEFYECLIGAYPNPNNLSSALYLCFGTHLDRIVRQADYEFQCTLLIEYYEALGRLKDLINCLHERNPENQRLRRFVESVGLPVVPLT